VFLVHYADRQDRDAHHHYMADGLEEALALLAETVMSLADRGGR
jgi:hypothetical protein